MAPASAILISCSDDFLLANRVKEVLAELVPEADRIFGLETVDCAIDTIDAATRALNAVRGALVQQGFFSDRKTVWMRDVDFLDAKRLQKSDFMAAQIDSFCDWLQTQGIPEGFTLLVSSTSIPKTSRFYKTFVSLSKAGKATIEMLPEPSAKEAVAAVMQAAARLDYKISRPVADELVARVGYSPRVIAMEVEKLSLYTKGVAPTVTDVETICTMNAGGEFWDLTTAFGNHDLSKTIKVLRNMYEMRVEPIFLVMQLEGRLNDLYLVCDGLASKKLTDNGEWSSALSAEDAEAVGRLGKFGMASKSPWVLGGLIAQARKWDVSSLKRARTVMITAHERMVSVSVDTKALLEMAITDALKTEQ